MIFIIAAVQAVGIVPGDQWAGMWRSDGSLSDMVNP
jgi:hypothetical protein